MYQGKYSFVALVAAVDWFFVPHHADEGHLRLRRIAAWATTSGGLTVGLAPVQSDLSAGVPARLEPLASERSTFKHLGDLTDFERSAITGKR